MLIESREKAGRNDPCPCGSGKKFKRCCLVNGAPQPTAFESPWSRQREASDKITTGLLKLAARELGDDLLLAWSEFNQVPFPEPITKFENEESIFNPYLIFDWDPESPLNRRSGKPRPGVVLRTYMEKFANQLSELERLVLQQAIARPVSFYEIQRCDPGRSAVLRDILIGEQTEVEEHTATKTMRPGDLVYGQIWKLPEVATVGRLAPCVIPPGKMADVVALRVKLRRKIARQNRELAVSDLIRYCEQIRTVYLDIRDSLFLPKKLLNTDGDPFVFHTLTFRIGSAQVAFDALASLAWNFSKEELLEDAERNADGSLRAVEFDWIGKGNKLHKNWDNTILGNLKISGRTLVVDVNSAIRAKRIREEIERRLGMNAAHLRTTTETPEEALAKRKKQAPAASQQLGAGEPPLGPEMQKELAALMQEHVETWVHNRIPALGGRTPLEAVRDPDGREIVESLLLGWERNFEGPMSPGSVRPDIDAVRRLLNLPVAIGTVLH